MDAEPALIAPDSIELERTPRDDLGLQVAVDQIDALHIHATEQRSE